MEYNSSGHQNWRGAERFYDDETGDSLTYRINRRGFPFQDVRSETDVIFRNDRQDGFLDNRADLGAMENDQCVSGGVFESDEDDQVIFGSDVSSGDEEEILRVIQDQLSQRMARRGQGSDMNHMKDLVRQAMIRGFGAEGGGMEDEIGSEAIRRREIWHQGHGIEEEMGSERYGMNEEIGSQSFGINEQMNQRFGMNEEMTQRFGMNEEISSQSFERNEEMNQRFGMNEEMTQRFGMNEEIGSQMYGMNKNIGSQRFGMNEETDSQMQGLDDGVRADSFKMAPSYEFNVHMEQKRYEIIENTDSERIVLSMRGPEIYEAIDGMGPGGYNVSAAGGDSMMMKLDSEKQAVVKETGNRGHGMMANFMDKWAEKLSLNFSNPIDPVGQGPSNSEHESMPNEGSFQGTFRNDGSQRNANQRSVCDDMRSTRVPSQPSISRPDMRHGLVDGMDCTRRNKSSRRGYDNPSQGMPSSGQFNAVPPARPAQPKNSRSPLDSVSHRARAERSQGWDRKNLETRFKTSDHSDHQLPTSFGKKSQKLWLESRGSAYKKGSSVQKQNKNQSSKSQKTMTKEDSTMQLNQISFVENMFCPVCKDDVSRYDTPVAFHAHWLRKHCKFKVVFPCPIPKCFETLRTRQKMIQHVSKFHNKGGRLNAHFGEYLREDVTGTKVECKPEIDPGDLTFELNLNIDKTQKNDSISSGSRAVVQPMMRPKKPQESFNENQGKSHDSNQKIPKVGKQPEMPYLGRKYAESKHDEHEDDRHRKTNSGEEISLLSRKRKVNETGGNDEPNLGQLKQIKKTSAVQERKEHCAYQEIETEDKIEIIFQPFMVCPVCQSLETFPTKGKFREHWEMCHVKLHERYFCPLKGCSSFASSRINLQFHYRREHNQGREDVSDDNLHELHQAKKETIQNPQYTDPGNLVFFPTISEKEIVYTPGMKCPTCFISPKFDTLDSFQSHWEDFHTKFRMNFFCPSAGCITFASSIEKLKRHYWDEHNYGNDVLTLATMETLHETKTKILANPLYLNPEPFIFGDVKPYEIEFEEGMTCPICPAGSCLKSLAEYRDHWKKFHVELCEYHCCPVNGCPKVFRHLSKLRTHFIREHNEGNPSINEKTMIMLNDAPIKVMKNLFFKDPGNCVFSSLDTMGNDIKFVGGMKCPVCKKPKTFQKEYDFKLHWQYNHVKYYDAYACPYQGCEEKRVYLVKLIEHYKKSHNNSQPLSESSMLKLHAVERKAMLNPWFVDPLHLRYSGKDTDGVVTAWGSMEGDAERKEKERDGVIEITFTTGMYCPLCKHMKKARPFQKVYDFRNHWLMTHIKYVDRYTCPEQGCYSALASIAKLKQHFKKTHYDFNCGDDIDLRLDEIPLKKVYNKLYLPPKNFVFDYDNREVRHQVYE